MLTVGALKERLAQIGRTVVGVKRAYAYAPKSLAGSDLPALLVFTGPGGGQLAASDTYLDERGYLLRLIVRPVQSGVDGEAERACEPFFEPFRTALLSHAGLGLGLPDAGPLPGVLGVRYDGDSGTAVFVYAGQEYVGIEFRVSVTQMVEVNYAAYE
jgi:hypothetical protein